MSTSTKNSEKKSFTAMEIEFEEGKPMTLRERGRSFTLWIIGLLVSLSPLLVSHFGEFLDNNADLLLGLFSDVEIFFICVSMLVSASCEINAHGKNRDILNGILLLCIIFFALLYSEFEGVTLNAQSTCAIAIVTAISLGITLLLGIFAYFGKRR